MHSIQQFLISKQSNKKASSAAATTTTRNRFLFTISNSETPHWIINPAPDFQCAVRVLKLRLETLRWSACTNEFPLSARTCGIFPICWADCNESEPKRSQEARAEKISTRGHERGNTEIDFSWSKSVLCTDLCRCRFCTRRVLWVCVCVCVLETKGEQISSSYMQVGRGSFREALNISSSWWRAWKCLKRRLIPRVKSP